MGAKWRLWLFKDAVFEVVAHEESESWTILHIVLSTKVYYSFQVSRVCVTVVLAEI